MKRLAPAPAPPPVRALSVHFARTREGGPGMPASYADHTEAMNTHATYDICGDLAIAIWRRMSARA